MSETALAREPLLGRVAPDERPLDQPSDSRIGGYGRQNRFRWLRLSFFLILGPLAVLVLARMTRSWLVGLDGPTPVGNSLPNPLPHGMPPSLLIGGRWTAPGKSAQANQPNLLPELGHDLQWLQSMADMLHRSWGLGSSLQFAAMADEGKDVESVIRGAYQYQGTCVVGIIAGAPPTRRKADELYMSATNVTALSDLLPLSTINTAAGMLEGSLGRRLFPMRLSVTSFNKSSHATPPWAVYDISTGRIILDDGLVQQLRSAPKALTDGLGVFAESMFTQLASFIHLKNTGSIAEVAHVVVRAAVAAIGVAIAYKVPLWFCIACPAVLGLLAPLVINMGLGALANAACEHWSLPTDECNDLWYGAFAAGMVLSLASAIPITFICKLPQCAHRQ